MKKLWISLFALVMVFALTACSGGGNGGSSSGDKTEISFWGPFSGPDGPKMKEIVDNFNKSQDKYKVNFQVIPQSEYYKKVDLAFNSKKNLPDVLIIHGDQLITYASKGVLKDMSTILGDKLKKEDYNPTAIEEATIDDTLYGLPLDIHPLMLYWNKDMFKAAGLDPNKPPQNKEQFIEYAKKLTDKSKGQYGYVVPTLWPQQFIYPTLVFQYGGELLKNGKPNYTSEPLKKALQFEHDLIYKEHVSPKNVQQDGEVTLFMQGKNAMQLNGPWMLNQFLEAGLNIGEAPVPQIGGVEKAVYANSHNFTVPKSLDDKDKIEGIKAFLNYVQSNSMSWAESGQSPAAKATYQSDEFKKLEFQPNITKEFEYAQFAPQVKDWGQMSTPLWDAINNVLLNKQSVDEALKEAQAKAEKVAQ